VLAGVGGGYVVSLVIVFAASPEVAAIAFGMGILLSTGVGFVAGLRAAGRPGTDRRGRLIWRLIAVSFLFQIATMVLFAVPGAKMTFPAPADGARISFVVLLCVATWAFPLSRATSLERRKSVLDALTVVVSGSMLLWYLILGPYMADRGTSAGIVAAAAVYPMLDLLLIFGLARVLLRGTDSSARRPILLLAVGTLFLFAGDAWVGYMQAHTPDVYRDGKWDFACVLTMHFLFTAAAIDQNRPRTGLASRPGRYRLGGNLPYAAIGVGYGLMIIAAWHEQNRFPWSGLTVGGIAITVLVVLRQIMVQRESDEVAATDGLTGLANRFRFSEVLGRGLDRGGRNGHTTAVLLVDMNGFKQVNDTMGHKAGDALLTAFARMLRDGILGSDLAARLGGDEFAVVLHDIGGVANAEAVARRIAAATDEPVMIDGTPVRASVSIGIAVSGPAELSPDELLHRADVAMYHAKRRGGATRWACFDDLMGGDDGEPSLEDDLRTAVAGGQLRLLYQPIVGLPDGELIGVEALVRWEHPRRGTIAPDVFIPLAERIGVIGELGLWVLREACTSAQRWPGLQVNVNVSPCQLDEDRFSTDVRTIVRATGMDPGLLVLEVTESALIAEEVPRAHLQILSDEGIRIALDDFGTGYSSLRYLTQLPIDTLKIDRGFVASLDGTAEGAAVAQAVLRLSRVLGLDTVAEGVETAAQARELTLLGGTKAQGFHFARPQPAEQISELVTAALG
jgi:diguanylate cyclase (GGDEF)-like protein